MHERNQGRSEKDQTQTVDEEGANGEEKEEKTRQTRKTNVQINTAKPYSAFINIFTSQD